MGGLRMGAQSVCSSRHRLHLRAVFRARPRRDAKLGQEWWGYIAGFGGLAVALLAPFLGAIADEGGRRKPWVLFYALVMVGAECAPVVAAARMVSGCRCLRPALRFALANVAYDFSAVFHNAMLPSLVPNARIGRLSGLGYALGNLAGLLLLGFRAGSSFFCPNIRCSGSTRRRTNTNGSSGRCARCGLRCSACRSFS